MKAGVSGSVRRRVFREFGYTCQQCGLTGYERRHESGAFTHPTSRDGVYLSIDHVVPRALGGSSAENNLRVLCTHCNSKKGTSLLGGG